MRAKNKEFDSVLCTKAGNGFTEDHVYPALGWNNGITVFRADQHGDVQELLLHGFGTELGSPATYPEGPIFKILC